jgi:membrane associated rhomboid family serine protease
MNSPVVTFLLLANGLMFLLELSYGGAFISHFALWPLGVTTSPTADAATQLFQPYQLISYSFLHGSLAHLLLNMYGLWLFGTRMETAWGSATFAVYYLVCVIGAGATQLLVSHVTGGLYPTIGASGGVFGLLLAFSLRYPEERLMLLFPPVILKAKWFAVLYAAIELWAGVTSSEAGVAHFAHLGGMLFGLMLILYWRRHPPRFR